ncbi:MAG TPA: ATP-binding protein [Gemmatimonadaceae bacterium]
MSPSPIPTVKLTPAQQRALDTLLALPAGVGILTARRGMGRTAILRAAHAALGGRMLGAADLTRALETRHPLAAEDALYRLLADALGEHETVVVDDLHLVTTPLLGSNFYPRQGIVRAPLAALADEAAQGGRRLIAASDSGPLASLWPRSRSVTLEELAPEDYAHVARACLGDSAAHLDFARVHRFARRLSARQLRESCEAVAADAAAGTLDTERFVDHLRAHQLASNVDLAEVQAVDLAELKGVDDVLRALEANIVLPFERADLATELSLRPKRGVLLVGPPGTGKTTIGRALAHRLRGKFFLIDGTVVAGTPMFFQRVHEVVEAAKQNAPAVIFIDDSDVIFEGGGDAGFYRYLLTMLDGLESESVGRVCVMMTAMDVGSMPPALVRSGRVELWLEMRLPDEAARAAILADRTAALPRAMGKVDVAALAAETEGLSGADLKRLVEDAKLLFAYDVARGVTSGDPMEYLARATAAVRENRQRYAEAELRARTRHPGRPSFFDMPFAAMHGMAMMGEAGEEGGGVAGALHVFGTGTGEGE